MKYKLIKKLPFEGSPEVGYVSTPTSEKDGAHYWNHNWFLPENYPEFWEKVEEKDYEILSFKIILTGSLATLRSNGNYLNQDKGLISSIDGASLDHMLKLVNRDNSYCVINSIRRLSDNEIFTVGDMIIRNSKTVKLETIEIDELWGGGIVFNRDIKPQGGECLKTLKKAEQPLFTTKDGKDVFLGDRVWYVNFELNLYDSKVDPNFHNGSKKCWIYFSTKELAEEYVILNKPCLCVNDVINLADMYWLSEQLKELVKKKL